MTAPTSRTASRALPSPVTISDMNRVIDIHENRDFLTVGGMNNTVRIAHNKGRVVVSGMKNKVLIGVNHPSAGFEDRGMFNRLECKQRLLPRTDPQPQQPQLPQRRNNPTHRPQRSNRNNQRPHPDRHIQAQAQVLLQTQRLLPPQQLRQQEAQRAPQQRRHRQPQQDSPAHPSQRQQQRQRPPRAERRGQQPHRNQQQHWATANRNPHRPNRPQQHTVLSNNFFGPFAGISQNFSIQMHGGFPQQSQGIRISMNGVDMLARDLSHLQDFERFAFESDSSSDSSEEGFAEHDNYGQFRNLPHYYDADGEEEEEDDEEEFEAGNRESEESEEESEEEPEQVEVVRSKRNTKSVGDVCVICTESFCRSSPQAAYFECNHWFHFACIAQWLRQKNKCPHCMTRVTVLSVNNG